MREAWTFLVSLALLFGAPAASADDCEGRGRPPDSESGILAEIARDWADCHIDAPERNRQIVVFVLGTPEGDAEEFGRRDACVQRCWDDWGWELDACEAYGTTPEEVDECKRQIWYDLGDCIDRCDERREECPWWNPWCWLAEGDFEGPIEPPCRAHDPPPPEP